MAMVLQFLWEQLPIETPDQGVVTHIGSVEPFATAIKLRSRDQDGISYTSKDQGGKNYVSKDQGGK